MRLKPYCSHSRVIKWWWMASCKYEDINSIVKNEREEKNLPTSRRVVMSWTPGPCCNAATVLPTTAFATPAMVAAVACGPCGHCCCCGDWPSDWWGQWITYNKRRLKWLKIFFQVRIQQGTWWSVHASQYIYKPNSLFKFPYRSLLLSYLKNVNLYL